ncbi:MAG TPA: iron-sulfur cluster assembly scaffold protein [Steroidobacteraceae bacterium]|nr:iron-sulfur cluster assembly scaffold protein [Steroidobacteraceae bacterium]
MKYSELTRYYFETAAGAGVLSGPGVYRGAAGRRAHGTWVQFDLHIDSGIIRAARFLVFGCPHTIAVTAWVAEHAAGSAIRTALPESVPELSARFAVPVEKRGRLLVIEDAWLAAAAGALQR